MGGPSVHWAHGRIGAGFASLGIRIGIPAMLGLAGFAIGGASSSGCRGDTCKFVGMVVGAGIGSGAGIIVASLIDVTVLAQSAADDPGTSGASVSLALGPSGMRLLGRF